MDEKEEIRKRILSRGPSRLRSTPGSYIMPYCLAFFGVLVILGILSVVGVIELDNNVDAAVVLEMEEVEDIEEKELNTSEEDIEGYDQERGD